MDTSAAQRLRLRATPDAARRAREALTGFSGELSELEVAELKLLTSELVNNAVMHPRHAAAPRGDSEIELITERTSNGLRVEVRDHDASSMPVVRPESVLSESGMGLRVVQLLATDWGSHVLPAGAGKAVWFEYATSA